MSVFVELYCKSFFENSGEYLSVIYRNLNGLSWGQAVARSANNYISQP